MGLEEVLDLGPKAHVSSYLSNEEIRELEKNPAGWQRHREELDEFQRARSTNCYETLQMRAYRDLYGFSGDDPLGEDRPALRQTIERARGEGMERNLGAIWEKARLETVLLNSSTRDPMLERLGARWVPYLEQFVFVADNAGVVAGCPHRARRVGRYEEALADTEKILGARPKSFDDHLEFTRAGLEHFAKQGCPAMKLHCGYLRSLHFAEVPRAEAARLFARPAHDPEEYHRLQDFLMRHALSCCVDLGLPVQVHASIGGISPGLRLGDANCTNLQNLMLDEKLRRLKLILLHGGYPFWREAGYLAENYANVYVEFSWLTFLFRRSLKPMLEEWLELAPCSKFMFGTDAYTPECYYAATVNAREVLGEVVAELVEEGAWTARQGEDVIRRLLRENARRVFDL